MAKPKKQIRRRLLDFMMLTVLICGVAVLSYPFVRNFLNDIINQQIISHYQKEANQKSKDEFQKKLSEMEEKNKQLAYQNISPGFDPFSEEAKKVDETKIIYEDHVIGVISIPKIKVRLPIFDQTTETFLAKGANYLEGTSFPIGGDSTHSVISGHLGLTEAKLFTDLPKLKKKDGFYIELGDNEVHAYEVDKIKVVKPSDVSSLQIVKGQDYITLVTCTPYMVNSHRLLVRGHRVPYVPEEMAKEVANAKTNYYLLGVICAAVLLLILIILLTFRKFKKRRKLSPKK